MVVRKTKKPVTRAGQKKALRKKIVVKKKPAVKRVKKAKRQIKKKVIGHHGVLHRPPHNPMIEPSPHLYWESKATFNPSAIYVDGKVHLVYRAIGHDDISVLGYATSSDGLTIDTRSMSPAYSESASFAEKKDTSPISYISGGGWNGGVEDPRLTRIDNRVYLIYTAFDGWSSVRIALTSISLEDFAERRWNWKKPVFISPPGEIHKNWVLFPEKINGKFAILHGISPHILIDYVDSMDEFDGKKFIKSARPNGRGFVGSWDNWLRGVGPAPLKTEKGWLVLYHAMDVYDPNRYKIGAMLLDLKKPTEVLVRSSVPVLAPDEWYENRGFKAGVVYACGAVIANGKLFVYYGGADTVVCVATAELKPFLKELTSSGSTTLRRARR